jgi:hypothetical protein
MTGLGALQRRLLAHLHTPEPRPFMTAELAEALLGNHDREAVRRVRRAVDALARQGLVKTWTGPAFPDGEPPRWWTGLEPGEVPIGTRRYMLPTRSGSTCHCSGASCELCALGDRPYAGHAWDEIDETYYPVKRHDTYVVHQRLSRVRWVELAWEQRPVAERLALLDGWITEYRAALAEPPHTIFGDRWAEWAEQLTKYEEEASALRQTDPAPLTGSGGPAANQRQRRSP